MGAAFTGVALGTLLGPPIGGIVGYYVNLWAPFAIVSVVLVFVYIFTHLMFQRIQNLSPGLSKEDSGDNTLKQRLLSSDSVSASSAAVGSGGSASHGILELLKDSTVLYVGKDIMCITY